MSPTMTDVVREIRRLAEENPNFVYEAVQLDEEDPRCLYLDPETREGSCIVGQALLAAGVPVEDVERYEEESAPRVLRALVSPSSHESDLRSWAGYVQSNQDSGFTWSRSVEIADQAYEVKV